MREQAIFKVTEVAATLIEYTIYGTLILYIMGKIAEHDKLMVDVYDKECGISRGLYMSK